MLASRGGLQREVLLAVVEYVLQFGAEGVEVLLLLGDDVLKHLVRDGVLVFGSDARSLVIGIYGALLQLQRQTEHVLDVGHLPGAERSVHIDVALQEEDAVGELLDMAHLGDRDFAHDLRKVLIAVILEMGVEIHVLE